MKNVAVLGYGTVGSGVVEVLETNKELIAKRAGEELNVKYILDLRDFPGDPYESKVTHSYDDIINDDSVSIICETMGGLKPAYDFTKNALLKGKSVCTSNKELVAAHGPELIKIAKENKCNYFFEASVGGGIPIIRPINEALTAEKIDCIQGILNGTTNYILTKMEKEGADFDVVLKEAQEKGYAERNPEADVEGYDACRKIAILSSLMYGQTVNYEDIYTEGITKIDPKDFEYAKKLDATIKLIGMSKEVNGQKFAIVSPRMICGESPLKSVNDVFNAIFVHSNMLGDSMYYGRGAGKLPTASAVVGDVVEAAKLGSTNAQILWDDEKADLGNYKELCQRYFVRVSGNDQAAVKTTFGEVQCVSLDSNEFAFVTAEMSEKEFDEKLAKLTVSIIKMIRM